MYAAALILSTEKPTADPVSGAMHVAAHDGIFIARRFPTKVKIWAFAEIAFEPEEHGPVDVAFLWSDPDLESVDVMHELDSSQVEMAASAGWQVPRVVHYVKALELIFESEQDAMLWLCINGAAKIQRPLVVRSQSSLPAALGEA
jgi:hypothetical protein